MIKVLLVDDEKSFAATLAERLELRKIDVSLAHTGEDALTLLAKMNPDVVLLDLSLPDTTGLKLLKQIKEFDSTVEVIILTGRLACEVDGRQKDAFSCISKPVKLTDLVTVITDAYESRRQNKGE